MTIKIYDTVHDSVIRSTVGVGKTTYQFAIDNLCPLIDRLDIQRNQLSGKLYKKMEEDIISGAILPPVTIAFISQDKVEGLKDVERFIANNIAQGFILDGIQRLTVIQKAYQRPELFEEARLNIQGTLYINIVISPSKDTLLYRMITLNNGQKPMSPRHQIEALFNYTENFQTDSLDLYTEKSQKRARSKGFKKSDVVKAYVAYMSNTYNVENKKIIESKMDELLVNKIIDNRKHENEEEFEDVLTLISRLCEDESVYRWFTFENNLVAFCSAIRASFDAIQKESTADFAIALQNLEKFFIEYFDRSKIKIGTERKKTIYNFIINYKKYKHLSPSELNEAYNDDGLII